MSRRGGEHLTPILFSFVPLQEEARRARLEEERLLESMKTLGVVVEKNADMSDWKAEAGGSTRQNHDID